MDDKIWITTIAALALGISIVLLVIYLKNQSNETPASFVYDEQNRLQSIVPMDIKLTPVGE